LELHPDVKVGVEQLYDLVLLESGSKAAAETAARDYMAAQLRRGETPE